MSALTMYRGDSKLIDITLLNQAAAPYDLTSCKLWFTVKSSNVDADIDALFIKTSDDDITINEAGSATIEIFPSDTNGLTSANTYVYDLQLKDASGRVWTVDEGTLTVNLDITRTTT